MLLLILETERLLPKLPVITEKCVLKGSFRWRNFFHFLINRNQTRGSILVSLVWLPQKKRMKENERTLINIWKHFRFSFCTPGKHIWLWGLSKARLLQVTFISRGLKWRPFVCFFNQIYHPGLGGRGCGSVSGQRNILISPLSLPLPLAHQPHLMPTVSLYIGLNPVCLISRVSLIFLIFTIWFNI